MAVKKKIRADQLMCLRELCDSTAEAAVLILAGKVRSNADHVIRKTAEMLPEDSPLSVDTPCPYVSRGAYKLQPALEKYQPDLNGKIAMDIGASTGGFTDLMLQHGAVKIYAIDSGRGQLHDRLRRDPRVVSHERTNARELPADFIPESVDLVTMDVSFISATALLPAAARFLKPGGYAFILVKPQFEAPREQVERGGVVRDPDTIRRCQEKVIAAAAELGWSHCETIVSPITGPKGNRESICVFRSAPDQMPL